MAFRKQDDSYIEYMRENVNPIYDMDQTEALNYAAGMGMSDSLRGIAQGFGKIVGWDSLTEKLKEKDKKLTAILNHPEYGTKANVAFLSSAIVADPVTYVPIAGWISKGKKAKNLAEMTKYGAITSGVVGGLGYTSEDRGLFVEDDASFTAKKAEQIGLSVALGGGLTAAGGKMYDVVSKARGNQGLFGGDDIIITKGADDVVEETENKVLEKGATVFLSDRNNQGQILSVNESKGTAEVFIVNSKTGKSVRKTYSLDELKTPKRGEAKKTTEPFKSKKEKTDEERFVINKNNKRKGPVYLLNHDAKDTTYSIVKVKDAKTGQFTGEWKVSREIRKENPMSDPSGEMGSGFPKLITTEDFPDFKTLSSAKEFVRKKINPRYRKPVVLPKEESLEIIKKEAAKIDTPDEPKLINPILKIFSNISSTGFKDLNFGNTAWNKLSTDLKGESGGAIIGGGYGYSYTDEEDNFTTNFGKVMAGAVTGAAAANRVKFLDDKYYNSKTQEYISRNLISDYGLTTTYLADKKAFKSNKSRIAMDFLDIVTRAEKDLDTGQTKLLFNFMVGDSAKIDELTETSLLLNKDARLLITKYGQEMVDLGVLNPKTFKKNIDTYLKRVYAQPNKNPKKLQSKIRAYNEIRTIGDELKPRGVKPKTILKTTYQNPKNNYKNEGWYVVSEKGKKVTVRRDYTKEERKELGELEDVAFALAETGRLLSNDVSVLKFFRTIKEKYAIDEATFKNLDVNERNLYKKVPDVQIQNTKANKYGDLSGMYLDRYTHNDLINTFRGVRASGDEGIINSAGGRAWDATMSIWKRTKTAWNIGTHVANTASNVILLDGADTSQKYLIKAFKEFGNPNSKIMRDAQLEGVLDADMVANELSRRGSALERKLIALQEKNEPVDGIMSGLKAMFKTGRKLPDAAERLYQAEDHVFRMAVYMDRLDKGFSKADAALEARKWFIDYDINAPLVQGLKRTVLPFVSYTYRIAPLLAEIAVKRPVKFAKWAGIGYALNELGVNISDDKEGEELNRFTMRPNENKSMFGMPFMPSAVIRTPWGSENGDPLYIDVTRWMPGGDLFEKRDTEGLQIPGVPAPLQPGGPLVDFAYMLTTGQDPFTGQDIESLADDDTATEELSKIIKHFLVKQPPNMPGVPGSYATEKLQKSLRVERPEELLGFKVGPYSYAEQQVEGSNFAVPFGIWESLVYGLGIKLRPVNTDVNIKVQENNYNQEKKELENKKKRNQNAFKRGSYGEEEYEKVEEELDLKLITLEAEQEVYKNKLRALQLKFSIKDAEKYNKEVEKNLPKKEERIKKEINIPKKINKSLTTVDEVIKFLGLPPKIINGKETKYTIKEVNELVNLYKNQKDDFTNEEFSVLNNIRLKVFKGGEVNVPYTKDEPEDRINPNTGESYSDTARLKLKTGGEVEGLTRIYDEDKGLKPVFPLVDLYTLATGGKMLFEGSKMVVKGSSIAREMIQQRNLKKTIPNIITHGSTTKNLKKYVKSGITVGSTKQAGIYGVGIKDSRVANNYAMGGFDSKNKRILGSRYNIDSSQYSDEAALTFKNIKKLKTNKVLDTSQPPASLVKLLDAEIKRTGNVAVTTSSSRIAKRLQEKHISLRLFKDRLKKNNIDASYMSLIRPDVKNFLNKNNYNLMKQDHGKDFFTNQKINSYVFLKNKVPIMKNGETRLVQPETIPDPLKITAMKKIFKD